MTEGSPFRRGDIILASFPFTDDPAESKMRPAVIIQNDLGNRFSGNLIVAAISARLPRREYPTSLVLRRDSPEARGSGLDRDSVIHAELIMTVAKARVARRIGRFTDATMQAVDERLKVSLALA